MAADVTASEGVYSIAGQEALANELAFGTPEAPEDDGGVLTDGGEAFDSGGARPADEPAWQSHQLTPAEEARLEFQAEQAKQLVERTEAEQAAAAQEQAYSEALENYAKLTPEEQFEVSLESVGRGLEAIAPIVNAEQAQALNSDLFAGTADAVPAATTLGYFADNVMQTLENAGITSTEQLTPEVAQQLTDPAMAHLFAQSLCQAIRMPELLSDGVVNPMEMATALLPYVPVLLSGAAADLYTPEYKLAFAQDVCRAFGQKQILRNIDPASAVAQFDAWAKWGGRLGAGLRAHRQQAAESERPVRGQPRNSRQARPSSKFKTNTDLFDAEALGRYSATL